MTRISHLTCNVCEATATVRLSLEEEWTTWQLIPYIKQQPSGISQQATLAYLASNDAVDHTLHTCNRCTPLLKKAFDIKLRLLVDELEETTPIGPDVRIPDDPTNEPPF